jgi:hypothetical protein
MNFNMDKKTFAIITLLVLIILSILGIGFLIFQRENISKNFNGLLNELRAENNNLKFQINEISSPVAIENHDQLISIIKLLGDPCGGYTAVSLKLMPQISPSYEPSITISYSGMDDSVIAEKQVTPIYCGGSTHETFTLGTTTKTWQCQPGRGSQDFSTSLCY